MSSVATAESRECTSRTVSVSHAHLSAWHEHPDGLEEVEEADGSDGQVSFETTGRVEESRPSELLS